MLLLETEMAVQLFLILVVELSEHLLLRLAARQQKLLQQVGEGLEGSVEIVFVRTVKVFYHILYA